MQVKQMIELALECGLQTLSEAYSNVSLHAGMLFKYSKVSEELNELIQELKERQLLVLNDEGFYDFSKVPLKDILEAL